ncbi:MAG: phosphate/phosphite/phosphonate ABC transporter substrate-binding protein [Desulfuromonadaceae bacterium]|nr:phosphate/phosphite/phosphonate ABC transporter substrate-binding protein [Desulfuromonadaceae bacterium]
MIAVFGMLLTCSACNRAEPVMVTLKAVTPSKKPVPVQVERPLRIGMGAMITTKEGYVYYQRLQAYIGKKLGRTVQLVDRGNYKEMNRLLETGDLDAAFVCAGPYVEGKDKFGMELLAMPQVKGKSVYYSYIIVRKDSMIKHFEDLRGKVFAFADPKSNSGKLVPTYMLAKMNETPDSFFDRHIFSYGHDQSIRAVADGIVDGAAVDSLVWEYSKQKYPEQIQQLCIIATSDPYGIPPVVVRPGLDSELKKQLKDILLSASADPEGNDILKGMMIDRFVEGDDANYNSIRKMNSWLARQRKITE